MTGGQPPHRPRRRWVWVLVTLATAAAFVVPFRLSLTVPTGNLRHVVDGPVSYRRKVSALQVQANGGAAVTIRAGRPGRVTVSSSLSWAVTKPTVTLTWQASTLWVGATCPKLAPFGVCQASIVIVVPAATPVQAQSGAGVVTVAGLTGPLHLSGTSGLLTARDVSGPVWASVTSGSLLAGSGLTSQHIVASATTGLIALDFTARPRSVAVSVGSGSARIALPAGSRYRIAISVGAGSVYVAPGLTDAGSASVLTARIGTGAANIGYAPAAR